MFWFIDSFGESSLAACNGKLSVYASCFRSEGKKFEPVRLATEKMARYLRLGFEVRTFKKSFGSAYVYYTSGSEEPIPIFQDHEGISDVKVICASLRNMMFVLSFHPRYLSLRELRKEIMLFS